MTQIVPTHWEQRFRSIAPEVPTTVLEFGEFWQVGDKMNFVFGPVPSRRLGQSLGIDPIPLKTCNWNCTYCQLGRSNPIVTERREYFPREQIIAEFENIMLSREAKEIDWVTLVGSGETTLHAGIGWLIRRVKALTPLPLAVITNGSLLYLPEVRLDLSAADAVLPSLDAGNPALYRKINRPHPTASFDQLIDGMVAFRNEYCGKLWVEVMLVRGLNDTEQAMSEIAAILAAIRPDEVDLVQPHRPAVEISVLPPDDDGLLRARSILGTIAKVVHPAIGRFELRGSAAPADAILEIITRHPMREDELLEALRQHGAENASEVLAQLAQHGKAQILERYGTRFWVASSGHYARSTSKPSI